MADDLGATFLGIDVGTSGVKAVLVDGARRALAEATVPLTISRPHPLWSEQNAEDWWTATEAAVAQLRAADGAAFARIAAIGLSGQMHGAVVLGSDDTPLRPVILWNDGRSAGEASDLHAANPGLADRLGVLPMPGLTFPKLLWLRRHEPDVFAAIDCLMLPKDYIRLKLIGERVSDMSDAAGTWGFDEAARRWSPEAAAAIELPTRCLPRLVEGSEVSGTVRADIAAHWGLRPGVVVAGGGGDAAAGAIGIGAINDGDSFISLGTSSQLVSVGSTFRPNVESLVHAFAHAVPQRWYQMGAMLTGASALAWGATILGRDVGDLIGAVEAQFKRPSDLIVLPYLTGERTPHNNPNAKAVIFGLTAASGQIEIAQAIMEAVAFTLADADRALGPSGKSDAPVAVIGGGARSRLWMRIIAGVLNRPLIRYKGGDKGPAFGAALLARLALSGEPVADVLLPPEIDDLTEPEPSLVDAYAPRVEKFRRLYQAVKTEF
jgi:xylulokinase